MVCKTSLSILFKDIPITDDFKRLVLGKPVKYKGRTVGRIIGASPLTDSVTIDIDDEFADELMGKGR